MFLSNLFSFLLCIYKVVRKFEIKTVAMGVMKGGCISLYFLASFADFTAPDLFWKRIKVWQISFDDFFIFSFKSLVFSTLVWIYSTSINILLSASF